VGSATRFAWLSVGAALLTIALKASAYALTGSVALLSDALESFVNLAGALMALAMLTVAARPADDDHEWGHAKAEYFSSTFEGALILIAALAIGATAVDRLLHPRLLEKLGPGLAVSLAAASVNYAVAKALLRASRHHRSITLEADARHLLTDVWTSAGVIAGLGAVWLTGWAPMDSICALLVAANIVWTGVRIVRESIRGLMDAALPGSERAAIQAALAARVEPPVRIHGLRTRRAGALRFVTLHLLVPGAWTVRRGHELCDELEDAVRASLPGTHVMTHLEPLEQPKCRDDAARAS
jgi:cation diffusion facilitator family transporter